jgi:hypothetical protein
LLGRGADLVVVNEGNRKFRALNAGKRGELPYIREWVRQQLTRGRLIAAVRTGT